jgi:hypothetical protein
MSIPNEDQFHHKISVTLVFHIRVSPHSFLACTLNQNLGQVRKFPLYKQYQLIILGQILILNVPKLVCPSALLKSPHK